jgi:hypothetical protein
MIQILLPPDAEEMLRRRAAASGEDAGSYAARLLQESLSSPTVDELLAPFRRQVEESSITDDELNRLGEELRREARQQARRS